MNHIGSSLGLNNLTSLEMNPYVMNFTDPFKTREIGLVTKTTIGTEMIMMVRVEMPIISLREKHLI